MYHLYIAEKPSVAQEFAKALKEEFKRRDGYMESSNSIVTWCVGHLVTMSYPEVYDPTLVRLIWVLFAFCGGCGLLAYTVAAIIMPD